MTLPLWLQVASLLVTVVLAISAGRSARKAQAAEHEAAKLRALEERVAERKYELYQPFVQTLTDLLTPSRSEEAQKRMEDAMIDFQGFVTLWASDEVNDMFSRYRVAGSTNPPPPRCCLARHQDRRDARHRDADQRPRKELGHREGADDASRRAVRLAGMGTELRATGYRRVHSEGTGLSGVAWQGAAGAPLLL